MDKVMLCENGSAKFDLLQQLKMDKRPCVLSFINAHAANLAWEGKDFYGYLLGSDVLLRDGIGLRILVLMLGRKPGLNLNGTDFIPEILDILPRTRRLAVFGTEEPYLSAGVTKIRGMGFCIVSMDHGFHNDEYYVGKLLETSPDVILLAMGMPKQERIAAALKDAAGDRSILIINGGAIIDFLGGRIARAPIFIQRIGMEWLFRLVNEPGRLWKRYVIGNIMFIGRAIALSFALPFIKSRPFKGDKK
jgi:exopolysaccharide biosynthesis WecB/TagA/CpsF family protein